MHFTVVFGSHESRDNSYGLVFVPCPVWVRGDEELVNLHRDNPQYIPGDLQPLLDKEFGDDRVDRNPKQAVVVVHPSGHGSAQDLERLVADLEVAGFRPMTVRMNDST